MIHSEAERKVKDERMCIEGMQVSNVQRSHTSKMNEDVRKEAADAKAEGKGRGNGTGESRGRKRKALNAS